MRGALLHWPAGYPSRWPHHAQFAGHVVEAGEVHIVVRSATWAQVVLAYLAHRGVPTGRVRMICMPYDDVWVRDCGPTLVRTPQGLVAIANPYVPNGLGYHRHDSETPVEVARHWRLPVFRLPLIIEGGNLVPDGEGGLFLCDSVFAHNPDIDEARLASIMRDWFGITRLMILPSLPGELTGHADVIIKVAEPGVLLITEADRGHPWQPALAEAARRIAGWRTAGNANWQVHPMPMARGTRGHSEWTYVNALTINGVIVAPAYDPVTDALAEQVFKAVSPHRTVRWIDSRDFPVGATHCQSKEIPV
jgi:agmatine deiminase